MKHAVPGLRKRRAPKTAFKKGQPRPPGAGRKKGTPNKVTSDIKQMIVNALKRRGGEEWFFQLAMKDRRSFTALVSRLLPTKLAGHDGGPLDVQISKIQANLANLSDEELKAYQKLMSKINGGAEATSE